MDTSDLIQDWIVAVIGHIVSHDSRISALLERKNPPLKQNFVLTGHQVLGIRNFGAWFTVPSSGIFKQSPSKIFFDFVDGGLETFHDCLASEGFDGVGVSCCWHDDERNDGDFTSYRFETIVESSEGFNKHIDAFIPVLVSTSGEEVKGIIEIEIIMTIKMTSNKFVDDILLDSVQILEFMHRLEFDDIQTIG